MRQIQGWGFEISFWAWAEYQTGIRISQIFSPATKSGKVARRVDGRIMGGMLLMTMGGFGMAQMMWQCWVQAKSDMIYTFKDQGTIGNFSVQNLGGLGVQSVQMGTRQGPSHPRSQIALPEMQILLQIGKRESGFQQEIDGGTYLS